jgi:DNA replication protein DnaC
MTTQDCPFCEAHFRGWRYQYTPWVEPRVTRCVCYRAAQDRARLERAGIPARYRAATFETFEAYNDSLMEARRIAQYWADSYPEIPRRVGDRAGRGLVLMGPAGIGKTHLVAVLLKQVITQAGCRGLFYSTKDLLRLIRGSYNAETKTTEAQVLDPVLTCELLVLDDLGEERVTDWVAEMMNTIVNTRYNTGRPIICTTNYADVDDPDEMNGLLWRIGFRMQSRLHEMCEFIDLAGASYRDLPPNGTVADLRRLAKQPRKATPARAQQRRPPTPHDGKADLKWSGGKGGNT